MILLQFDGDQEAMKVCVKVSGELGAEEQQFGGLVGHRARLGTEGQVLRSLDQTADLSVSEQGSVGVWPGLGDD